MFEKVNPSHPDKVADRIAGAIIDIGYQKEERPKIACEVLIGHDKGKVIIESSVDYDTEETKQQMNNAIYRITEMPNIDIEYIIVPQDKHLSENQSKGYRCGDNGIFVGKKVSKEEQELTNLVGKLYKKVAKDGKYIYDEKTNKLIVCQSNIKTSELLNDELLKKYNIIVNPLGDWTGGINVDTGATNRKLGSDMGRAVTGGGIGGKDCSKADVSVNIYMHLIANETSNEEVQTFCAIGDNVIRVANKEIPYEEVVNKAHEYIKQLGGFEKFAEWGLIRPEKE